MKKITLLFFCAVLTMTAGCSKQPTEQKLITTTIAFQEWVGYGLFYLAKDKGFMKEEGVDLIFVDEQLDSARRDAFKQGMLDFEAGTLDLLISKAAQDTPIVVVMEIDISFGADAIVALENIKTLEDLAGKRLALAKNNIGETLISTLFYKKGLLFDRVIKVYKKPEKVAQAFLKGEADACVTWEPQVTEALKRPGAHILTGTKEEPGIIIDTLNVRRDLLENNPELVKKVMRGWFKALSYYKEHPLDASKIISKYYRITPEQYRKQVEGLKWESYEKQKIDSKKQRWIKSFNIIIESKLANKKILKKPDITKLLNHALLEKLYENSP